MDEHATARATAKSVGGSSLSIGREDGMISLDDLIAFCGLKAEEVQAIAEHEPCAAPFGAARFHRLGSSSQRCGRSWTSIPKPGPVDTASRSSREADHAIGASPSRSDLEVSRDVGQGAGVSRDVVTFQGRSGRGGITPG